MYRCVCFNFKKFHEQVDDQYRFKGNDLDEIRCSNGSRNGVCTECRKNVWTTLTEKVSTKSFKPDEILKTIFSRTEVHGDLCKNVPKYDKNGDVPNLQEHNKTVLVGLNQLLYQNYILIMMEEKKRVSDLLDKFKQDLKQDIQLLKSIQSGMDNKFNQLKKDLGLE